MAYARLATAFLILLVHASPASARPARRLHRARSTIPVQPDLRFLGHDPIGPLARVRGGGIAKPGPKACLQWGRVGTRWRELDALGQIAGEVKVVRREHYDVSGCDELSVKRVSGRPGAGVYVGVTANYHVPTVARWRPDNISSSALERLAETRQQGIANLESSWQVPFSKRVFFFEWASTGERYAVIGGRSLLVVSWRGAQWRVVHEEKPATMRSQDRGYAALMVTDMNSDGRPELVVHNLEESGEWYGDSTLSLQASGRWVQIRAGIFGSTA